MKLTKVVPFLVEDELLGLGAIFEKKADWQPFSITDARLILGIGVVNEKRRNRTEEL